MMTGWLSPEGKFYECGYMEHLSFCDDIVHDRYKINSKNNEEFLENHGWVKISMTTYISHELHILWKMGNHLTEKQKEFLLFYYEQYKDWLNKSCRLDLEEELFE